MLKSLIVSLFLTFLMYAGFSQSRGYTENKGQWDREIIAKYELGNGAAWFFNDRVRFPLVNESEYHEAVHVVHDHPDEDVVLGGHAYEMIFGQSSSTRFVERHDDYINYYMGSDRSKWASRVGIYDQLTLEDVVSGIDLHWSSEGGRMKYTFEVEAGVKPSSVNIEYAAIRGLQLIEESLVIKLPNMEVEERAPYAYQVIDGREVEVECHFQVKGNIVSFKVGDYDSSQDLFIDPVVVASTNVGAAVSTYGHSATFDQFGNIYGGGRPFGAGYPTDTGSFQMDFAGGGVDIGLSKLNEDGSDLLWSTYIGGTGAEYVHSIVVNGLNQVAVLGKTNSTDYPVSESAFDTTYNGDWDICVTILSDSGDSLIGSTYIGGEAADGSNNISSSYAAFKGEVECDLYSNVYVASTTMSDTFPVTTDAYQMTRDSLQDGVVCKLNYDLSQMTFSTYLGGEQADGAFNVKPAKDNSVYVCGITASDDFPSTLGAHDESFNQGFDGFITRLSEDGTSIIQSTFIEADSNTDDKAFFLQLDRQKNVYVLGTTTSNGIVADTNKYAGPGTGSFIRKYGKNLDTLYWTSTFANISHSAFLVDNCLNIYAAGNNANSAAVDTVNAVQNSVGGFYVMVLGADADSIIMGSHYGTTGSHVDGGTSRFDKRGAVYQATCTNGAFPLTSNAWSGNQNGGAYDLTVFKIDMEVPAAVANSQVAPNASGCMPFQVDFSNYGSQGLFHYWDFDDGDTSNLAAPTHTFTTPGTYWVTYVISDTAGCQLSDTSTLIITVYDTSGIEIIPGPNLCVDEVELTNTSNFSTYLWSTGETQQTISVTDSGEYWLEVTNICGTFADTVDIDVVPPYSFELGSDTSICEPGFMFPGPASATSYLWNTGDTTQNVEVQNTGEYFLIASNGVCSDTDTVNITVSYINFSSRDTSVCYDSLMLTVVNEGNPITWSTGDTTDTVVVYSSGSYWVLLQNGYCSTQDTINVDLSSPLVDLGTDTVVCVPTVFDVFDSTLVSYEWSTGDTTSGIQVDSTMLVWVIGRTAFCADTDTLHVTIPTVQFETVEDLVCDKDSHSIMAPGPTSGSFVWSNGDSTQRATVYETGEYYVTINTAHCEHYDSISVVFANAPVFDMGENQTLCRGQVAEVSVDTVWSGLRWSTGDTGSTIYVKEEGIVTASMSADGCEARDSIEIAFKTEGLDSLFMVPNVITPNSDGLNDVLSLNVATPELIDDYKLVVYNRWGMLLFEAQFLYHGWDGRLPDGSEAEDGVYFYIMEATTVCTDIPKILVNDNVTLIR